VGKELLVGFDYQGVSRSGGADYSTTLWWRFQLQKTIKLKITTTRKKAITLIPAVVSVFCPACRAEVQMLTCREAAVFLEIGEQDLAELIAGGKAHAIRTLSGSLRVCQDSLLKERIQTS
jgi:hypothetical protein